MKIVDNILGEIVEILSKHTAIKLAKERVDYHNSQFNYKHRGKHNPCNAVMTIDKNTITIDYKDNIWYYNNKKVLYY